MVGFFRKVHKQMFTKSRKGNCQDPFSAENPLQFDDFKKLSTESISDKSEHGHEGA